MRYREVVDRLGFEGVCLGGCGITNRSHERGFIFLDVVHWQERRVMRPGLRKFLLLVAKRDRLAGTDYLNDEGLWWAHFYLDQRRADQWAKELGVRFPIAYSAPERRAVSLVPGLSRKHPAVWAWARRGDHV
jgi:hypothetical protein